MPIIVNAAAPVRRPTFAGLALGLVCVATACGTSTMDLGHDRPVDPPPAPSSSGPTTGTPVDDDDARSTWEWVNPAPQGNRIRGIGGSADDDVWIVGDGNTAVHWDGERWTDRHGSLRGLDLYSVWSSGPRDAWALGDAGVTYRRMEPSTNGYARKLNAGGGTVLHFDGADWKEDPRIGKRWAHAIWGSDASHVIVLLEQGDVGRFDGTSWTLTAAPAGAVLRDVWGTSANDVWAVGDGGAIAHFDGASWTRVPLRPGAVADPAAPQNAYYGVWGSSANDVWAVFVDPTSERHSPSSCEQSIGLSHWDGQTWTLAQTVFAPCSQLEDVAPQTDAPSRLGHQLWGGDGTRALAMSYRSYQVLAFDGATWRWDEELSWSNLQANAGPNTAWSTGIRTLWGRPGFGALFAAGEGGALYRVDAAAPPGQQLSDVFPAFRQSIRSIRAVGDEIWAMASYDRFESTISEPGGDLVRWTTGGWSRVNLRVEVSEGVCEVAATSLSSSGPNDVWVTGGYSTSCAPPDDSVRTPVLVHWNGSSWSRVPLPAAESAPYGPHSYAASGRSVWLPRGSRRPWILQLGSVQSGSVVVPAALYRFDGASWETVALPDGYQPTAIGGASDTDVWVASYRKPASGDRIHRVFHLVGDAWSPVSKLDGIRWREIAAASANDLWLRANPERYGTRSTTYHWDGQTWIDRSDLNADAIWPAGDGHAFFLSHDDDGANFMVPVDTRFELGYWDGASKRSLGETSATVTSLVGTKDALWVAGQEGATLRFPLGKTPR